MNPYEDYDEHETPNELYQNDEDEQCCVCGEIAYYEDMEEVKGKWFCSDCYEKEKNHG